MKVYPISMYKTAAVPGLNASAQPAVQSNVDHNEGYAPHEFSKLDVARSGKVAIVGYGPSLERTYEQLESYDTIWTVSGAHDFLFKRGLAPTLHTDIDFRKHKIELVTPRAGVRYVMANTVHPEFIKKVSHYDLTMFQPIGKRHEKWFRYSETYPKVQIDGDVAMAAMILAAKEGFTEIDVFGVDCSEDPTGATHAGPHGGVKHYPLFVTDAEHNLYRTNTNLIVACQTFVKVVRSLPESVSVTVIGDGLLPAWIDMVEGQDG